MCFIGRLTRLLNTLVSFYDDIELQISDSKTNNKYYNLNEEKFKNTVRKELLERQYNVTIINK